MQDWIADSTMLALGIMQLLNGLILAILFLTMRFRYQSSLVDLEGRVWDKFDEHKRSIELIDQRIKTLEKRP